MDGLERRSVVFSGVIAVLLSASVWAEQTPVVNPAQVSEATRRQVEGPVRWIMLADKVEKERKRQAQAKAAALVAEHSAAQVRRVQSASVAAAAARPAPAPKTSPSLAPIASALAPASAAPAPLPAAALPVASIAPTAALPLPVDVPEEEDEPAPKLLDLVEPFISDALKARLRGKGNIVVRFRIQPNGTVRGAEVVETSHPALRQPVLTAVEQWRYAAPGKEIVKLVELQIDPN
ncbi:TonB family protein [Niveibacterium terrae]|uniref:TonB family protein n=1 Tax=Niveibacterium terrae TaxID=3373598 RepID=UPI003A8C9CF0